MSVVFAEVKALTAIAKATVSPINVYIRFKVFLIKNRAKIETTGSIAPASATMNEAAILIIVRFP